MPGCSLSQNIVQDCFASVGGIKKLYITEYGNISNVTVTNGQVTAIALVYGKKFYEYALRKQNGSFTESLNVSDQSGLPYYDAEVSFSLTRLESVKRNEIEKLAQKDVIIIVVTNAGQNILVGHKNGLSLTTGTTATGQSFGDLSGYTLSFTGGQPKPAPFIASSFLPALINPVYGSTSTTTTFPITSSTTTVLTDSFLWIDNNGDQFVDNNGDNFQYI